jgi:tRNA dimethylallyltransferase
VGYRQVWEYLDGDGDRAALAERGAAATRSLAKRQLTWLGRWPHLTRLTPAPPAHQARRVAALGLA